MTLRGTLPGESEAFAQLPLDRDHGVPVDRANVFRRSPGSEQQRNARIGDEMRQTVDAIVAAPIRNMSSVFLVPDAHKAGRVAARRRVRGRQVPLVAIAKNGCRFDEGAIMSIDVVDGSLIDLLGVPDGSP